MLDYCGAAYEILSDVYGKGTFSQLKLNEVLERQPVGNAALVTKIVYGVLENDLYLEHIVRSVVEKKPKNAIMVLLKMGAYLLRLCDAVPDYAVVNNLVNLTKRLGKGALAGFVNAALTGIKTTPIVLPENAEERLSIQYSYPLWFVQKCIRQYGQDLAIQMLSYRGQGKTAIRRNALAVDKAAFERLLRENRIDFEQTGVKNMYYVTHGTMKNSKIPHHYYVNQGISSVLVCRGMGIKDGDRVLDACAAPGGKSVCLAEMTPRGSIVSWDIHEHRVKLVRQYAARMGVKNLRANVWDATQSAPDCACAFDAVLCDVPCSGFGVVSDRPDIKLNRREEDIAALANTQGEILRSCADYVRLGGTLMYSTCTVLAEENQDVVDRFLCADGRFVARPIDIEIEPAVRYGEYVQLLPCLDGVQGFFMAKLERVKQ